jgi:hypothetical protein
VSTVPNGKDHRLQKPNWRDVGNKFVEAAKDWTADFCCGVELTEYVLASMEATNAFPVCGEALLIEGFETLETKKPEKLS